MSRRHYSSAVPRSAYSLAALAAAAVPALDPRGVRMLAGHEGEDVAEITDIHGSTWTVRAPSSPAASAALEGQLELAQMLADANAAGSIPFTVPQPQGWVDLPDAGRAVVMPPLVGQGLDVTSLRPGVGLAASLGRAIGSLHHTPVSSLDHYRLPTVTSSVYRSRRLEELDQAAATGYVPVPLLRRWEGLFEDSSLWRYQPVLLHGDLSAEHILVHDSQVDTITGWDQARIADPADDLSWLLTSAPEQATETIIQAYLLSRPGLDEPRLEERALLLGELAIARWLVYGVHHGLRDVIREAQAMLKDLNEVLSDG